MVLKIALAGICVCIVNSVLKQYSRSFVIFTDILFSVVVASFILGDAASTIESFISELQISGVTNKLFLCLFKGAVICVITKFACDISRESGNAVISDVIEFFSRVMLLTISMPFIESIVKTAISFAK